VPEPLSSVHRLADFLASDSGDAAAGDLLAASCLRKTSADKVIIFAAVSWPSTLAAGSRSARRAQRPSQRVLIRWAISHL
jgi:hypothetical protein